MPSVSRPRVTSAPLLQPAGYAGRAMGGLAAFVGSTAIARVINFGSQIVLAWLISTGDFGLVGMTYTVASFALVLSNAEGLTSILIQRQRRFATWATPTFWLSMVSGVLAVMMMLAAAPLAAKFYGQPQLIGLIAVIALSAIISSSSVVPKARIQSQMRYKTLALIEVFAVFLIAVFSVLFAWLGFGAYSFVLPQPLAMTARSVCLWWLGRPRIHWRLRLARWPSLVRDGTHLIVSGLAMTLVQQGDYIVLGRFASEVTVGLYFFAFNLSTQTLRLLAGNLMNVLLPVFSQIQNDKPRQREGFIRVGRTLMAVGLPMCFLQAALADPVIRVLFAPRWYPAVPLLQVLSVGMGIRLMGGVSTSMLKGSGQFRQFTIITWLGALSFIACMLAVVGFGGGVMAVALAVMGWSVVYGCVLTWVAIRGVDGTWRDVLGIYGPALLLSSASVGPAVFCDRFVMQGAGSIEYLRIGTIVVITIVLFPGACYVLTPSVFREGLAFLSHARNRIRRIASG